MHIFKNNLSLTTQAGLLTKPYDRIILDVLEIFYIDALLLNIIGEALNEYYVNYGILSSINLFFAYIFHKE